MRKIALLSVLILVVAGGYTAFWFKKSGEFKQMLEQSIASLNEQAKNISKDNTLLRYDSIDVSGFPFAMTLQVKKPVVDLPVAAFLQKMPHEVAPIAPVTSAPLAPPSVTPSAIAAPVTPVTVTAAAPTAVQAPADWVEEISYGDSISVSGNLTGTHFTLTMAGDRTHKSLVNHTVKHTLVSSSSSPLVCHLGIEQAGNTLWVMQPIFTDLPTFLSIFRSADCDVQGITLKDAASGTLLLSADGFSVSASNKADGTANRKIDFKLDSKNTKALPAFDALVNEYMSWGYALRGTPDNLRMATPFSEYGAQDQKIDIHYNGPANAKDFSDPAAHMLFDSAFDVKNAMANMQMEIHVDTAPQGEERVASIKVHSVSNVTERYDQLIAKQTALAFTEMMREGKTGQELQIQQTLLKLGTPEELTVAMLPKFHEFGTVNFDVDANVKGPNHAETFLRHGNFALDTLNWVAAPYGLKFKGALNATAENKIPSGDLLATCISCDALITDFGNYAMRIEAIVNRMTPGKTPYINAGLINGVKQFLHGIAEDANAKDAVIHIVMKDNGILTISGKPAIQAMGLFGATIAPYLQHPAAAPAPAAAPVPVAPAGQ